MSLINQVLSDLEKRGVRAPNADMSIRPVPQEKKYFHPYLLSGLLLMVVLIVGVWGLQKWLAKSSSLPIPAIAPENVMVLSQMLVKPQEEPSQADDKTLASSPQPSSTAPSGDPKKIPDKENQSVAKVVAQKKAEPVADKKSKEAAGIDAPSSLGKKLIKMKPQQQAENEFHKATLLVQQGQLNDAIAGFEMALQFDPGYDKAREGLVAVLLTNKANAEAEKVLQEGVTQNEKQTRFAMLLARLQVERNALPLALQTLEKTLPFAGAQADYQAFMAALLQRHNRHAEAIAHYQIALQLSPNSGVWLMGQGLSLQAMKRNDEARDSFKRAIETRSLSPALQSFVEQRLAELK
jgi:MSHA biogenesis protein MshN